jgi:hypothetical protein
MLMPDREGAKRKRRRRKPRPGEGSEAIPVGS